MRYVKQLILILLFPGYAAFAQQKEELMICGSISVMRTDTAYMDFKITLLVNDSIKKSVYADSSRNYVISFPKHYFQHGRVSMEVEDIPKILFKTSYCGDYSLPGKKYMVEHLRIKPSFFDSTTFIRENFTLALACSARDFPTIEFGENQFLLTGNTSNDSIIHCLAQLLKAYPTYVIEIACSAAKTEQSSELLPKMRVEVIKGKLVSLGIDPRRLIARARPFHQYELIDQNGMIKKPKTKQDREELDRKRRTVSFALIRRDFKE